MRETTYVRVLIIFRPPKNISVPLAQYAKGRKSEIMLEGQLLGDIRIGEGIRIMVDLENGHPVGQALITLPVIRLEPGYALTEEAIYQIVRIPRNGRPKRIVGGNPPKKKEAVLLGTKFVTGSQRSVLHELLRMAELCGNKESYGGIKFRARPLVTGFSGAGKSTLISYLCEELAIKNRKPCPLLRISSGSWSLINSTHEPYTLKLIRDFVRERVSTIIADEKGFICQGAVAVVLLDEIDKLASRGSMSYSWYRNVVAEFISLSDGDSRLLSAGWTETDIGDFQSILLIGAGAFLDGVPMYADQDKESHLKAIGTESMLPDEVRRRFNSKILYLEVPNPDDYRNAFERLYRDLSLPLPSAEKLEGLITMAEEAKKGMRFLEEHLADLLIEHPQLRRARLSPRPKMVILSEPPAEPEPKPKSPPSAKATYEGFVKSFRGRMFELEEPLVLVQLLFRAHRQRFTKFLVDETSEPAGSRALRSDSNFTMLLGCLRYEYAVKEEEKERVAKDFWSTASQVFADVHLVIEHEHQLLLKTGCLPVFADLQAKLSRLLKVYEHFKINFQEDEE